MMEILFFLHLLGDGTYFFMIKGFSFSSPVINGASHGMVVGIGAIPFRVNAGAGRDDDANGIELFLYNGIGGEGGADHHSFDVADGYIFKKVIKSGEHGFKQI